MTNERVLQLLDEICDLITGSLDRIDKTRYDVIIKPDGSPVTTSDILVENMVRDYVTERLPSVVFIGEESFDFHAVKTDDYVALLDPIDGTENFCSGLKEWGVSFSLWKDNVHRGSFLFMPELGIRLLSGDKLMQVQSRLTGLSSSLSDAVIDTLRNPGEYRMMGCAVYNIYNVIRGSFQRFVNPKGAYVWDILPGMMLALEHGCSVAVEGKPFHGQFLDPAKTYRIDIQR